MFLFKNQVPAKNSHLWLEFDFFCHGCRARNTRKVDPFPLTHNLLRAYRLLQNSIWQSAHQQTHVELSLQFKIETDPSTPHSDHSGLGFNA
jgi:hypothetical protein